MINDKKYAVLIDADNISDKYVKIILDEISNYGVATYKRIYGDWTRPGLNSWKTVLLNNSVTPVQQYGYTTGKNATDSAMIIDAMDILYSENVDGFCLVTSDSDFTRLAARLRESAMDVVGMGEKKTPKAFISACNAFKYLDVLSKAERVNRYEKAKEKEESANAKPPKTGFFMSDKIETKAVGTDIPVEVANADEAPLGDNLKEIKKAVATLIEENPDEWMFIGDLGNKLQKRYPDFDVRNFGFKKFTPFVKSLDIYEFRAERISGTNNKLIYLREKEVK